MNKKVIAIMDAFEELLDAKGIEIPCEDEKEQKERHDGGNDAKIYGTEYGELYDVIEQILENNKTSSEARHEIFTPMEVLILAHLKGLIKYGTEFVSPNDSILYDQDPKEVFKALDHLVELHILKKRDCDGVAYELDSQFDWSEISIKQNGKLIGGKYGNIRGEN